MTEPLPVAQVAAIQAATGPAWLVRDLWTNEGVGIIGGLPKSCKTWLALDLALSVASGTPVMGRYSIEEPGPVLIFCAEDPPAMVKSRLEGFARIRGLDLSLLPIHVILSASLRLDRHVDRERLTEAVCHYKPRLLVLDPFVRLHRIDENSALEVSGLLAFLRELQRSHHLAVLVTHHARKSGAGSQAGLGLRGSGDFHAWGDVLLYLRRRRGALELIQEHRNARSPEPVRIELVTDDGQPPHLAVVSQASREACVDELMERVVEVLRKKTEPVTQEELRTCLRVRLQRLVAALRELEAEGRILREPAGWSAPPVEIDQSLPFPTPPL